MLIMPAVCADRTVTRQTFGVLAGNNGLQRRNMDLGVF